MKQPNELSLPVGDDKAESAEQEVLTTYDILDMLTMTFCKYSQIPTNVPSDRFLDEFSMQTFNRIELYLHIV